MLWMNTCTQLPAPAVCLLSTGAAPTPDAPSAAAMLLLRAAFQLPSPIHHRARLLLSTTASASTATAPFSLEGYLVAACGLAPAQARKTAQKAFDESSRLSRKAFEELSRSRLNSASNPDSILALLSGAGLSRADIAAVVVADPLLLRSSPKNIGPRLLALRDRFGLSAPQISRFLRISSRVLRRRDGVPKLEFFVSLFGSFEKLFVPKSRIGVLNADLERTIKPNIELLRQCGLSVRDIAKLFSRSRLLSYNPERVKEFVLRTKELGVPTSAPIFCQALLAIAHLTKENIAAKFEFLKSTLGCTESEIATAVCRLPSIIGLSEEYLLRKIQFLVNEVGLEPQYIVQRPVLLGLSLENRLMPRHCVMKVLQAKGLLSSNKSFLSFASYGHEAFRLKFIDCHKDSVPGLAAYYATSSARDVDPKVQPSS